MKTKAEFKALKRRISDETAVNVGYYTEVLTQLPEYALFEAIRQTKNISAPIHDDAELRNIIVTESVKAMNYQDFKEVAGMFFGGR